MAPAKPKYEVKVYAENADAKSGRSKVGETAIVSADNIADACDQSLKLLRDGVGDALGSIVGFNVKLHVPRAPRQSVGNPFAPKSE